MKAIVNIALRQVELYYTINSKDIVNLNYVEMTITFGKDWELVYVKNKIKCKQILFFKDIDEWQSKLLFDGRMIDFHYNYENRNLFTSKKDWSGYMIQGYEHTNKPQTYDNNVVTKVEVIY